VCIGLNDSPKTISRQRGKCVNVSVEDVARLRRILFKVTWSGFGMPRRSQGSGLSLRNTKEGTTICASHGVFHRLKVFNGNPVAPTKEDLQFDQALDQGNCIGASAAKVLQPGESKRTFLSYDTTKPGTYEFTVEQGTFPRYPAKNVMVRSNTVTIVVPDPGETNPK
jgi:hypothetical protein